MINKNLNLFSIASIVIVIIVSCNNRIKKVDKTHTKDPFKNTIVKSQNFEIDCKIDNVIEGENGTIIICPKGCFKNANNEVFKKSAKIELSEALLLEEMLLSNLTTTTNGKQLVTDGMIYFNVTAKGEQLAINKQIPVRIEIPTNKRINGMMAYKGTRDKDGQMNWIDPIKLDNYLVTLDIHSLDFLPEGFQNEVDKGMPFNNYKIATQNLTDSLYYSLTNSIANNYIEDVFSTNDDDINEEDISSNKTNQIKASEINSNDTLFLNCGIEPAIIKVIKSDKYQNTLIATREFETRLKLIFKTCNDDVLKLYINHLDKNLYEIDSMAMLLLGESGFKNDFQVFVQQRLTKVRQSDKYAQLLKGHFDKQLSKVKLELKNTKEKLMKELYAKNNEAEKVAEEYRKLLLKRDKFRKESYGFEWEETGWINIDKEIIEDDLIEQKIEINVSNGNQFDRVHTYVIQTSIKSLYNLGSDDQVQFYIKNNEHEGLLMSKNEKIVAIAIGYKNDLPSLAFKEFETGSNVNISMSLSPSNIEQIKQIIRPYDKYAKENKISKDLDYMLKIYLEEKRQQQLNKDNEFILKLIDIALPCCENNKYGENLFFNNCFPCHSPSNYKTIGPGLAYSTSKYSEHWLYKWTTDCEKLIKSGDSLAIKIFNEYGHLAQPKFNLSEDDVKSIFKFIDKMNQKK
jgi:hypothetical protein